MLLTEKTDAQSFEHIILILVAIKLFKIGRLSSGRASEFDGLENTHA
jgi:predicted HTH domain antitoxin